MARVTRMEQGAELIVLGVLFVLALVGLIRWLWR